jgi:hypothetical protein
MNAATAYRAARDTAPGVLDEARGWVQDCVSNPDDVEDAAAMAVVLYVDREYAGGWQAFLAEAGVTG